MARSLTEEWVRVFMQNNDTTPQNKHFFHLGIHSTVFQAEVLAIPEVAKNLLLENMPKVLLC